MILTPIQRLSRAQKTILSWYSRNGRAGLPWRATRDPYRVLVSELMLQQTQVSRVIPKYNAFIAAFPTITSLADAKRTDVLRHWQGLGYNNRAVRLHTLAKLVRDQHGDRLPRDYEGLRKLPGIGPYTAGAIMGFAYDLPAPCVDVNIKRVIARIGWDVLHSVPNDEIAEVALRLVTASESPHDWHSALMDFGSTVCTAKNPGCTSCVSRDVCASKGVRGDESDASARQSTFVGSVRWHRSQVLTSLLQGPKTMRELQSIKSADKELLQEALTAMERERLITRRGARVILRDDS